MNELAQRFLGANSALQIFVIMVGLYVAALMVGTRVGVTEPAPISYPSFFIAVVLPDRNRWIQPQSNRPYTPMSNSQRFLLC